MKKEYAEYLTKKTKEDYDKIASDFSRTRAYLRDDLRRFAELVKEGDKALDFGCGNGRLSELFAGIKNIHYTGVDQACLLIEKAREKYAGAGAEFICSDGEKLPFPDEYFNTIFAVASLHHIPSEQKRLELLAEFQRLLKPNGILVVTVWNLWQRKYISLIAKYTLKKISGQSPLDWRDVFVPWRNASGEAVAERYYHAFTDRLLKRVIQKGCFVIQESGRFGGHQGKNYNLYAIAKKL